MDAEKRIASHPDENLLVAFAEQTVTVQERQTVLEHLAACPRCREVVFLMQESTPPVSVQTAEQQVANVSRIWKRPLIWGYCAGLVALFAVSVSVLRIGAKHPAVTAPQVAAVTPSPKVAPAPAPALQQDKVVAEAEGAKPKPVASASAHKVLSPETKAALPALPQPMPERKAALSGLLENATPEVPVAAAPSAVSVAGGLVADRSLDEVSPEVRKRFAAAPSPVMAGSAASFSPGGVVSVNGKPALARSVSLAMSKAVFRVQNGKVLRCLGDNCTERPLPEMQEATSVVSRKNVALALGKSGNLFMSNNGGDSWQIVPNQWAGQAHELQILGEKALPQDQNLSNTLVTLDPSTSRSTQQVLSNTPRPTLMVPIFALRNEKGETWQSLDFGKTWQRSEKK